MRPTLPIVTAITVIALSACHPPRREPSSHHETRSFPATAGKVVSCDLRSLDLDVHVQAGDAIQVAVDLEVSSSSRGAARRWLESHTPAFQDQANRLEIAVPRRRDGTFLVGYIRTHGRVTLTLPPQCRLEVETASGDVAVDGSQPLAGPVRLRTASGDAEIKGGVDDLVMRTASGNLEIQDHALRSLEFGSTSGDLRVRDGCGNVIVDSSSGEVRLADLEGTLSATTSSGDVVASWKTQPARVAVDTSSGDVTLELPEGTTVRGAVDTRSGEIRSSFEGTSEKRGRRLRWDNPAGASEVTVSTTSGDVRLRRSGSRSEPPVVATPAAEASPQHVEI